MPRTPILSPRRRRLLLRRPSQKVQWILSIAITQIQIMLYPDENMANFTAAEGSVRYPGQNLQLQHTSWLFENVLLVSKNVLTNKFGMSNGSEEAVAKVVVEAATNFAQTWFPPPQSNSGSLREAQ